MAGLSEWAESTPDALALVTATERRTFAELDSRANQLAQALLRRGLQPGDAVALIAENSPAFVETVFACQRAGFRLTPVNWHLTAEEAAYIVQDCEAKALVATDGCGDVAGRCFRSAGRVHGRSRRRRNHRGLRVVRQCARCRVDRADRQPCPWYDHALHVGHDGTPEGCPPPPVPPGRRSTFPATTRRAATSISAPGRCTTPRRWRSRCDAARLRGDRGADGEVGRRGHAAAHRASTGSPTPTWFPRCSTGCCRCPTTCGASTTCRACVTCSTARRRVRFR